ncbi:hypothetical protein WEI85_26790 [Actinomycetes bacterium KLBMP 9797]
MDVEKNHIIELLRSRGLHERADWVDRVFPEVVDTHKNSSLLRMLQIDPTAMAGPKAREGCRNGV